MKNLNPDDFFFMANLMPKRTGLPYVVWISQSGDFGHDVCVWVSRSPKAVPSEMVRATIRPNVRVKEGEMDASDLCAGDDRRV